MTVLVVVMGLAFGVAGGAKLAGAAPLASQFDEFGLSRPVMRLVGGLEIAGAIGLQLDRFRSAAALGLAAVTVGAIVNHVRVRHPISKMVPAAVLFTGSTIVAVYAI